MTKLLIVLWLTFMVTELTHQNAAWVLPPLLLILAANGWSAQRDRRAAR